MSGKFLARNTSTTDKLMIYIGSGLSSIEIGQDSQKDLLEYYSMEVLSRSDVLYHINAGDIVINDGSKDLSTVDAIRLLFSVQEVLPRSEVGTKIWVHESAKPEIPGKSFTTQWVGFGDDLVNHVVGAGPIMKVDSSIGTAITTVDVEFDPTFGDVYLHEGYIQWADAGMGDYLQIAIFSHPTPLQQSVNLDYEIVSNKVVPASGGAGTGTHGFAGNPILTPNVTTTGHWDYNSNDGLLYNATTTGAYDIFDIEQEVSRYVNGVPLYGTAREYTMIRSADAAFLPPGYFIRLQYHNISNGTGSCWMFMTAYRERTI